MNTIERICRFSPDRKYRYTLWRKWDAVVFPSMDVGERKENKSFAMFIGLNPSTADETKDDPTIRRCIGYAKAWGYGELCMTNLFGWRETVPARMKRKANPVGLDNQYWIVKCASEAGIVVAAWGANGKHRGQDMAIMRAIVAAKIPIHCIRRTQAGHPEHPLYLPKTLKPILYTI